MARLQILHIPAPPDEYPFVLVIDKVEDPIDISSDIVDRMGAQAVLVFREEVEVL